MLINSGMLRQFNSGGSAVIGGINHYYPLTMKQLGKVLLTAAANISGSSTTASLNNTSVLPWIFALGADRFIMFHRDGSNNATAGIMSVGASSITLGTFTALRSASASIGSVKQNPVNPLQFSVLTTDGYTHLVTAAASGTTFTTSSHNTGGTIGSIGHTFPTCSSVWAADGTCFITCTEHGAAARVGFALFTVSGTTLSYVNNTTGSNAFASMVMLTAEPTGESSNECVVSATRAATNGHVYRVTFTSSAITIAMQLADSDGTNSLQDSMVGVAGHLHIYPSNTSPYPTARKVFDGTGSGQITGNLIITNGGGLMSYYSKAPFGPNMNWDLVPDSSPYPTYPGVQGFACSFVGPNSLATRDASTDAVGFCVSHDYTKSMLVVRNGTTYTFRGFNTPT